MKAKDIIDLMDEASATGMVKLLKAHGKAAMKKLKKLKARIADKPLKKIAWKGDKPVIVMKTAAQRRNDKKGGKRLHKSKSLRTKKKSSTQRLNTKANKILARANL